MWSTEKLVGCYLLQKKKKMKVKKNTREFAENVADEWVNVKSQDSQTRSI